MLAAVVMVTVGFVPVTHGQLRSLNKLKKQAEDARKKAEEAKKTDGAGSEKPDASSEKPAASSANPQAGSAAAQKPGAQPDLAAVKIDFVPGERTVFLDDFSDMAPDEPPPHWKVRGGAVSLKLGQGVHELAPGDGVILTSGRIDLPKDFTMEIVCICKGEIEFALKKANNEDVIRGSFQGNDAQTNVHGHVWAKEELGTGEAKTDPGQPFRFALWAQQGRIRAYFNDQRIVDVNQVDFSGIDHLVLDPSRYRYTGIRSVRIAESAPDVSSTLATTGKYVTHGIAFDTDSDRLRPESAAVVKSIAGALIKNPNLKIAVHGYTDSMGSADHNLDLSKRRAAAVVSVLVSQFGIDASRLTADGFGAKDPIGSNDTADGRAQNRRVEFVRQ
jgi:outer membrane protein OmpA-like peptidoglycan-associated protein